MYKVQRRKESKEKIVKKPQWKEEGEKKDDWDISTHGSITVSRSQTAI
jgi:hypothetical protein